MRRQAPGQSLFLSIICLKHLIVGQTGQSQGEDGEDHYPLNDPLSRPLLLRPRPLFFRLLSLLQLQAGGDELPLPFAQIPAPLFLPALHLLQPSAPQQPALIPSGDLRRALSPLPGIPLQFPLPGEEVPVLPKPLLQASPLPDEGVVDDLDALLVLIPGGGHQPGIGQPLHYSLHRLYLFPVLPIMHQLCQPSLPATVGMGSVSQVDQIGKGPPCHRPQALPLQRMADLIRP